MRVLIIKTSSMGDIIHTFPAITDAKEQFPSITFDWVVEEAFVEIPSWHPAVDRVIPVAIRRWRKNIAKSWRSPEWRHFKTVLNKRHYDLVIDAQGLIKSAWLTKMVKAPSVGLDKRSAKEPIASVAYQRKVGVVKKMHAVERTRELFAAALGYKNPRGIGHYNLSTGPLNYSDALGKSLVFIHGTTRADKHWPELYWRELCEKASSDGFYVKLPWGTEEDKARAQRLAEGLPHVEVLPKLNIKGVASALNHAVGVVSVDTGLGHLAAALDVPTVSLYGSTSPELIGAYGNHQIHLLASDFADQFIAKGEDVAIIDPQVFAPLTSTVVYESLISNIQAAKKGSSLSGSIKAGLK